MGKKTEPQQSKLSFATKAAPKKKEKKEEEAEVKVEEASPTSTKENKDPEQGTFEMSNALALRP